MKYVLVILMIVITIVCFDVDASTQRDPFKQIYQNSCRDQTEALLKQLQAWQFKGVILSANSHYQKIWLSSSSDWIAVSTNQVPNQLLPWKIGVITTDKVIWQAKLPDYCDDWLSWTMLLDQSDKRKNSEMAYDK